MPQIPVYNPAQKIEAGSPAEAVSVAKAGEMSEQAGRFSETMFKFGNMLDEAGRKAKNEIDKIDLKIAENELERQLQYTTAEQRAKGVAQDDPTGVKAIRDGFNPKADEIKASIRTKLSPEAQRVFDATSGNIINDFSAKAFAQEIDKREKLVPVKMQQLIGEYGQGAFQNPSKSEEYVAKAVTALADSDLPDNVKQMKMLEVQSHVYSKEVAGRVRNAQASLSYTEGLAQFDEAKKTLNTKLNKLLAPDDFERASNRLDKDMQDYIDFETKKLELKDKLSEKELKKRIDAAFALDLNKLAQVANDDFKRNETLAQARLNPLYANAPEKIKELENTLSFKEYADDSYQNKFIYRVLTKKDYSQALRDLQKDTGSKVSVDRANKLQKDLDGLIKQQEKNPNLAGVISSAKQAIAVKYGHAGVDPRTGEYIMLNQAGANALANFSKDIANTWARKGVVTPSDVMETASKYNNAIKIKEVPGVSLQGFSTSTGINQNAVQIASDLKNGRISAKEAAKKLKGLRDNKAILDLQESTKVRIPQEPAPVKEEAKPFWNR